MIKMGFKKIPNGDIYYFQSGDIGSEIIVKSYGERGRIIKNLYCHKDLVGKKVRLKLEIVEDET